MTNCDFCKQERKFIENTEKQSHQQLSGNTLIYKYCAHNNSLAPRQKVMTTLGGINMLTCGGLFESCMLTEEQFADVL